MPIIVGNQHWGQTAIQSASCMQISPILPSMFLSFSGPVPLPEHVQCSLAVSPQVPSLCSFSLLPHPSYLYSFKSFGPQLVSTQCFLMIRLLSCILFTSVSAEHPHHHESSLFPTTTDPAPCEEVFRDIVLWPLSSWSIHWWLLPESTTMLMSAVEDFLSLSFLLNVLIGTFLQGRAFLYLPLILIHLFIFIWTHEFLFHVMYFLMLKVSKFCH